MYFNHGTTVILQENLVHEAHLNITDERVYMKLESLALHYGYTSEATTRAAAVPIYQTTSYTFDNTQHGADLFDLEGAGEYLYAHHESHQCGAGARASRRWRAGSARWPLPRGWRRSLMPSSASAECW